MRPAMLRIALCFFGLAAVPYSLPVPAAHTLPDETDKADPMTEWSLPGGSTMAIKIFGCIMPLPPGYFLHTDSASAENLDFNRLAPIGFLRIGKFEPIDQDVFDVVRQQQIGQLTIITIRAKKEQLRRHTLTIIHDGRRRLSIAGDDEDWAEPMARYCTDHPL